MEKGNGCSDVLEGKYFGRILRGEFSLELKTRVMEGIEAFSACERTPSPVIPYLAAFRDGKEIWYEYVSDGLARLLECDAEEVAGVLRESIVERRNYRYHEFDPGVLKDVLTGPEIPVARKDLRRQSIEEEVMEAVYKIRVGRLEIVWLKDRAVVERFPGDGVCLSFGHLTPVTREMEAEAERDRLLSELQTALGRVKILSGLLPICATCKKVRDDGGYWRQIEVYIRDNSEASFSHGICPGCLAEAEFHISHFRKKT